MNKTDLINSIIERLVNDQQLLMKAARTAHHAATDPENSPDNKYETLALESSYIAQGQANRAQEILQALNLYRRLSVRNFTDADPVYLTALIDIEDESRNRRTLFLGPAAGGLKVTSNKKDVMVITPESPLGKDLIGKGVGDLVEIKIGDSIIEYELVEVR